MTTRRQFLKTCAVSAVAFPVLRLGDVPAIRPGILWAQDAIGHWFPFTRQPHGHYLCLLQSDSHYPDGLLVVDDQETLDKFMAHGYVIAQHLTPYCEHNESYWSKQWTLPRLSGDTRESRPFKLEWIGL